MISTNYSQQISIINLYIIIYYKFFLSLFYILQFENKLLPHSCTHNITKSKPKLHQKKKKKIISVIISAHISSSSFVIQLKSFGRVGSARSGTRR